MLQSLNVKQSNIYHDLPKNYIPCVTGYTLALSKAPAAVRAFTAAKLTLGWVALVDPRVTQVAHLCKVNVLYVNAALKILKSGASNLENAVLNGDLSLLEAAALAGHPGPTLAEKFMLASQAERAVLAKAAGPTLLWDTLVAPYV